MRTGTANAQCAAIYAASGSNNGLNIIVEGGKVRALGNGGDGIKTHGDVLISGGEVNATTGTGLTARVGDMLDDIILPDGWTWDEDSGTPVGSPGTRTHSATFTPGDTDNYNTITLSVSIAVRSNVPALTGEKNVTLTYRGEKELGGLAAGENLTWSSSAKYVTVDPNTGKITSQKAFWKTGGATIKAENDAGYVEFNVKVRPTFWQWLLIIFLFGWIWY